MNKENNWHWDKCLASGKHSFFVPASEQCDNVKCLIINKTFFEEYPMVEAVWK